jgi:RimJ/RimL family protein N-acetyltransferase
MAELWFPVPPLAGDVVLLRPWREADVPGIVMAFSDPVMQRFSWRTTPYTETDARDYFAEQEEARLRGDELNFALVEPHDQGVVLGAASLYEVRLDKGCAAVGYWLAPEARGRGAATHAVRLLARWAFAELVRAARIAGTNVEATATTAAAPVTSTIVDQLSGGVPGLPAWEAPGLVSNGAASQPRGQPGPGRDRHGARHTGRHGAVRSSTARRPQGSPPSWWLLTMIVGILLAVAALTAIPARLGARRPLAEILQAELA